MPHVGAQGPHPGPCHAIRTPQEDVDGQPAPLPPDGSKARVFLHTQPGAYTDEILIEVLRQLRRHVRGKITVIWDLLNSHRSRAMKAWLRTNRHWIVVEELPAYACDLNPCEALWGNLKGQELANLCPDTVEECVDAARAGIRRVRRDEQLAFSFLDRSGLPLRLEPH